MSRENIAHVPSPSASASGLTEEQTVTLRRVAFGQSEERTLRPADLARLRALRLIATGPDGPVLTTLGRETFNALPRAHFAKQER